MMTLKDTRQLMEQDQSHAILHLMEFVDDFRREKDSKALSPRFMPGDERLDALAASTAQELCAELKIEAPEWLESVPACREPWFPSGVESLKAIALAESPLPFRLRKIFVMENFLSRV